MFPHLTVDNLTNRRPVLSGLTDYQPTRKALTPHLFGGYRKHLDIMVTQTQTRGLLGVIMC